jgi:hypothetical protein
MQEPQLYTRFNKCVQRQAAGAGSRAPMEGDVVHECVLLLQTLPVASTQHSLLRRVQGHG